MLFNSLDFAIFLPVVFITYWLLSGKGIRIQNTFILIASYFFYGSWSWNFLILILFSTLVDFYVGIGISRTRRTQYRKFYLCVSILSNLGLLGFFKYYNFFVDNFVEVFRIFGMSLEPATLEIILPVGISFYTFQTLSYTIDIYRNKINPTYNFIAFAAFVSFFPQLVAGPIERASHLLPQFFHKRTLKYSNAVIGLRQILWGLFKKIVVADNCAQFANLIFNNSDAYSGSTLALGAVFFTFQIYGDFSGYSDIAIGTARLFGFDLMKNFAYPYFSRDIAEFWRRWHISLSTWFRDYLYIPLGGSRGSTMLIVRNTFIIFLVSGFWHGANWTFIIWGALNAIYFLPLLLRKKNRANIAIIGSGQSKINFREVVNLLLTFSLTVIAWVFFRAENIGHAFSYLNRLFSGTFFAIPEYPNMSNSFIAIGFIFTMITIEWFGRDKEFPIADGFFRNRFFRITLYLFLSTLILLFYGQNQEFIYFQF